MFTPEEGGISLGVNVEAAGSSEMLVPIYLTT
jgi:hypothetical protein